MNQDEKEQVITEQPEMPKEVQNANEQPVQQQGKEERSLRSYGTVACKKCGMEYSALYKECPYCGYSYTREITKIVVAIIVVAALLVISICNTVAISGLKKDMEGVKGDIITLNNAFLNLSYAGTTETQTGEVDITDLQYYSDQLITDGMSLEDLPDDYLIYAHQDGCSACAEANKYVYAFLAASYPDYIPVYFITPQSNESVFFDELNCESTPTLYRMSKGEIKDTHVGVDNVYEGFNLVVEEANTAETAKEEISLTVTGEEPEN